MFEHESDITMEMAPLERVSKNQQLKAVLDPVAGVVCALSPKQRNAEHFSANDNEHNTDTFQERKTS